MMLNYQSTSSKVQKMSRENILVSLPISIVKKLTEEQIDIQNDERLK